jgi:hypothetical protein
MGEDKSCSGFLPLLDQLEMLVRDGERAYWEAELATPLHSQIDRTPEDDMPYLTLSPPMMECLASFVRRYVEIELAKGVRPEPDASDDGGEWRAGPGWRLYCAVDLLRAQEECVASGSDVIIHYD